MPLTTSSAGIGRRTRGARKKRGLTQKALAGLANQHLCGRRVGQAYLSRLERGLYDEPGVLVVRALEKALGLPPGGLTAQGDSP